MADLQLFAVRGIGEITEGTDLATVILTALEQQGLALQPTDILVVTQKIVSKAEGRVVDPATITPSPFAEQLAAHGRKDAQHQELVLRESRRIVKMANSVLITETHHGLICANAGIDDSNVAGGRAVTLLPRDPDASALRLRAAIHEQFGLKVAVIISDTFGRPWREGQVNVAIGVAGIEPLADYRGQADSYGYVMHASQIAIGDEIASAAELVMGKIDGIPVAIVRGYPYQPSETASARSLIRDPQFDLFR